MVDKIDDDAWGLSNALPIGVAVASSGSGSGSTSATKLGLVIAFSVAGICLLAVLAVCMRKRSKDKRREEKAATLDMLNKRRPAPAVPLNVEDMAEPPSPNPVSLFFFFFFCFLGGRRGEGGGGVVARYV